MLVLRAGLAADFTVVLSSLAKAETAAVWPLFPPRSRRQAFLFPSALALAGLAHRLRSMVLAATPPLLGKRRISLHYAPWPVLFLDRRGSTGATPSPLTLLLHLGLRQLALLTPDAFCFVRLPPSDDPPLTGLPPPSMLAADSRRFQV